MGRRRLSEVVVGELQGLLQWWASSSVVANRVLLEQWNRSKPGTTTDQCSTGRDHHERCSHKLQRDNLQGVRCTHVHRGGGVLECALGWALIVVVDDVLDGGELPPSTRLLLLLQLQHYSFFLGASPRCIGLHGCVMPQHIHVVTEQKPEIGARSTCASQAGCAPSKVVCLDRQFFDVLATLLRRKTLLAVAVLALARILLPVWMLAQVLCQVLPEGGRVPRELALLSPVPDRYSATSQLTAVKGCDSSSVHVPVAHMQ